MVTNITQVFLYKFLNDKFGYELKNAKSEIAKKLTGDVKWETAYENLSDDERMLIQSAISPDVPMLEPYHLIANLWNQQLWPLAHFASPPSVFITLAMFIEMGHLATHLPHPTQLNRPSLFSG